MSWSLQSLLASSAELPDELLAAAATARVTDFRVLPRRYGFEAIIAFEGATAAFDAQVGGDLGFGIAGENIEELRVAWDAGLEIRATLQRLACRLPALLRPVQITTDGWQPDPDTDRVEVDLSGYLQITADGVPVPHFDPTDVPPSEIVGTGIVVELADAGFAFSTEELPDETRALLGDAETFRGMYAAAAVFRWLPQLELGTGRGIQVDLENVAVGERGVTFTVTQEWHVDTDDGDLLPTSEVLGHLFDPAWEVALAHAAATVRENVPHALQVSGLLRLPPLGALMEVAFGLRADADATFSTTLDVGLPAGDEATLELGPGRLTLDALALGGTLTGESFSIAGNVSGDLDLETFQISVTDAAMSFEHAPDREAFSVSLGNVTLGPLGDVSDAKLVFESVATTSGDPAESLYLQATVAWDDLPDFDIPDAFPDLPDSGTVTAKLHWREKPASPGDWSVELTLAADLEDVDSLWPFVPETMRPEVRDFHFELRVAYDSAVQLDGADASDPFQGELSATLSMRLPELPDFPGSELIELGFGDEEGWVEGRLVAGLDDAGDPYMRLGLADAVAVNLQLPGMPQEEAPVQTSITDVTLDIAASDNVAGSLTLGGAFQFRPVVPDIGLPIGEQMQALMDSIGLDDLAGTATLQLTFDGGDAELSFDCLFDDVDIEIDVIDMVANLARGLQPPEGAGSTAEVPLDLDVHFAFKGVSAILGTLSDAADAEQFSVALTFELRMAALMFDVALRLSDRELVLGIPHMQVPLEIPRFPLTLDDLDNVRQDPTDSDSPWDPARWSAYEVELEQDIEALLPLDDPGSRRELFQLEGQRFLLANIFGFYGLMSGPANEELYRFYTELFVGASEMVSSVAHLDSDICLVLTDVQFVIPFSDPRGIGLEGSAHLEGFAPDDPLAVLEGVSLGLGLSAEYIYFSLDAIPPIPLPDFGRYHDGAVSLSEFRLGYGYTKNSFSVAFNGEVALPPQLVDDADTSDVIGAGIRMPFFTALKFKLDIIPVTLGAIDFVIPLVDFDLDMRTPGSPALVSSERCEPYWDGLQVVAPGIFRQGIKHVAFSPLFSMLPIPNVRLDADLMIGDDSNGLTVIADDVLILYALQAGSTPIPIPTVADVYAPYFENLCVNVRLAGFGVNFNLQRPFPSVSPLALFEIIAFLSDPSVEIDPEGHLANILRVTLRDARISLPPAALRMFPEAESVVDKDVYVNLNIATVIGVVQHVAEAAGSTVEVVSEGAGDIHERLRRLELEPPDLRPGKVLEALPPELRKLRCSGAFGGFEATAVVLLIDSADIDLLRDEMALRDAAPPTAAPLPSFDPRNPTPPGDMTSFRPSYNKPSAGRDFYRDEPAGSLFSGIEFRAFDATDLDAIPPPRDGASGVVAGAHVKVFEGQRFRFLGAVFEDGSFALVSRTDVAPLELRVAGIDVTLPLELGARLTLTGRAKRDGGYGAITAEGTARWKVLPGVLRLDIGAPKPARLRLHSDGRFALNASCTALLFDGAARVEGRVDISETHCFVDGTLEFTAGDMNGTPILAIDTAAAGRIGPGSAFELSGAGDVTVLGRPLAQARALVNEKRAEVEGLIDTKSWLLDGSPIGNFRLRLALRGGVDVRKRHQPEFDLRGEGSLRALGAEVSGSGGVRCHAGNPSAFVAGALQWQGQDWLEGRVEASADRITVSGRTAFAVDLTPGQLGGIHLAGLFLRVAIGGRFELDAGGGLAAFTLSGDWQLAGRLAGGDQVFPLASQAFSAAAEAGSLDLGLVEVAGFKLLPEDDLGTLDFDVPVPRTAADGGPSNYAARVDFGFVEDDDDNKVRAARVVLRRPNGDLTGRTLELNEIEIPLLSDVFVPGISKRTIAADDRKGRMYFPLAGNFKDVPVSQALTLATDLGAQFGIGLTWTTDNHLAIRVTRPGQADFIKKLGNIGPA